MTSRAGYQRCWYTSPFGWDFSSRSVTKHQHQWISRCVELSYQFTYPKPSYPKTPDDIEHRPSLSTINPYSHAPIHVGRRWSRLKRWYRCRRCCPRPLRCVRPPIPSHLLSWPHAAATGDNRVIGNVLANGVKYKMQGSAVTLTPSSGTDWSFTRADDCSK